MTRKIIFAPIFFILVILFSVSAFADSNNNNIQVQEFYGGAVDLKLNWDMDSFYGARGDAQKAGGTVSTFDPHPSFTSYNPAVLAYYNQPSVSTAMFLPIPLGSFANGPLNQAVKNSFTSSIQNQFGNNTPVENPSVNVDVGQSASISDVEAVLPFALDQASIAFAREECSSFDFGLQLSGAEALVNFTDQSVPSLQMAVRAKINAMLSMNSDMIVTSLGIGRRLSPEWGIGVVVEKYDTTFYANGQAQVDAVGTLAGNTQEFNTDQSNSLSQSVLADLTGEAWGLRLGTAYHFLNDQLETAFDAAIEPTINFHGNISAVTRLSVFCTEREHEQHRPDCP